MILEFKIENYKSFKGTCIFSMIPDNGKNEHPENISTIQSRLQVLRTSIIYGANASGKSNFMKALQALRNMIVSSANNSPNDSLESYTPFKFNPESVNLPTSFTIDFAIDGIRYKYHISFVENHILTEELNFYPQGRISNLFFRDSQSDTPYKFGDSLKGQKFVVADLTNPNQLYLSKAAQNNIEQLVKVYNYFSQDFMPIPFLDSWMDNWYIDRIAKELLSSPHNEIYIRNFKTLLKSFDTGITDFHIRKKEGGIENDVEILAEHISYNNEREKIGTAYQLIQDESTGTQKLFVLGGLILRALMKGRVIMIDEFERSLHPFISKFLLEIFNDPEINQYHAQLIIATHDTNLLDKEIKLRRDQIWIVEKSKLGISDLFSLSDIDGVRKEGAFEKWYLTGRFGGVPGIEKLNFRLNFQKV